jgi:ferric-dicitrate binding protein FerR (iron transport regulator)
MNIKPDIEQLIVRYLNGESNYTDQQLVRVWIESSDENRKMFFQIKDIWDTLQKHDDKSEAALLHFYRQQANENNSKTKILRLWRTVASIASVLVLLFASVYFLEKQSNHAVESSAEIAMVSIKVPYGSRTMVNLSDGSSVMLNSGTEFKYPERFEKGKRQVSLSGEAYFKVQSDVTNPFIVKTNGLDVQATGTQFNVCSYPDDIFASVTLAEGKVSVHVDGLENVSIAPDHKLNYDRTGSEYTVRESEVRYETAWKDGEFRFKEILFPELIKKLERWYDVKLNYTSPELTQMLYSGNFKNQETIWQVLNALTLTAPIEFKKTGVREFQILYKPME